MVSPPPLVSPGVLSGPAASPHLSQKVLVGFLVTFQNEPTGSFWALYSGRTTLGRAGSDNKADIGVNDASASSRHAAVVADSATGQAFVEDDGSRNGTFLNEQKVAAGEQRQMHDNDRLRCGSTTFVVKLLVS
jgi:pSer/pThr/pTyr-binding forkhead associated (FHA) protein